jgi:type IV secretory pathway TrbD component
MDQAECGLGRNDLTTPEGTIAMFPGAWCGHLGVGAWALIGLFWATFLGLVVWAVGRLFTPSRSVAGRDPDAEDLVSEPVVPR